MSNVQKIGEEGKRFKEPMPEHKAAVKEDKEAKVREDKPKEEAANLLLRITAVKSFLEYFIMDPSENLYFDLIVPIVDYWNDCETLEALDHQSHLDLRLLYKSIDLLATRAFSFELKPEEEKKIAGDFLYNAKILKIDSKRIFVPYGEIFIASPGIFADRFLKLITMVEKINGLIAADIRRHVECEAWQKLVPTLCKRLSSMLDFFVVIFIIGTQSRPADIKHAKKRAAGTKNLSEYNQVCDHIERYRDMIAQLDYEYTSQRESVVTHSATSIKQ